MAEEQESLQSMGEAVSTGVDIGKDAIDKSSELIESIIKAIFWLMDRKDRKQLQETLKKLADNPLAIENLSLASMVGKNGLEDLANHLLEEISKYQESLVPKEPEKDQEQDKEKEEKKERDEKEPSEKQREEKETEVEKPDDEKAKEKNKEVKKEKDVSDGNDVTTINRGGDINLSDSEVAGKEKVPKDGTPKKDGKRMFEGKSIRKESEKYKSKSKEIKQSKVKERSAKASEKAPKATGR